MDDSQIIQLYFERSEEAINKTKLNHYRLKPVGSIAA